MDSSSASAYVYAKACGMLAKSFIGARKDKLFEVSALADLWTLLFNCEVPLVPEALLAKQIEEKAEKTFVSDFIGLLNCYNEPDSVLVQLVRCYDYNNIKDIGAALCEGKKTLPAIVDIGRFSMLDYKQWPSVAAITRDSSIAWYNKAPSWDTQSEMDMKLDIQYVRELWDAVCRLPHSERQPVEKLLGEYIVLQNCIWAIRLKVYYNMQKEDIIQCLAGEKDNADKNDRLAGEAVRILDKETDTWADWENWHYAKLLNAHEEGSVWNIDPRWMQQASDVYLNGWALRLFHQYPFTANVLVTWFKIKEHELNCIRTAAEGLRLNVQQDAYAK
ncbi:MAG: V0D/AC39 family V-type ATPase subunit [Treponema lecithinolyticum]|uniref:V0D/AC39 family V-type ATPase subunit n=1 Tax=Treponema lecithinolyticum TaxID=53418 RepID=UPI00361406FC